MLLLGIDVGTSSIKVSVVDAGTCQCLAGAQYPGTEVPILTPQTGWAEQDPEQWWAHVKGGIRKCHATGTYDPAAIGAIGISYQMHGLVVTGKAGNALRNAIIWCDGRAIGLGEEAFVKLGEDYCLQHLLNSPGNFTASRLAWLKRAEPAVYTQIHRVLLPGDYIALRLTGEATTTVPALSEGIFWDFAANAVSSEVLDVYGLDAALLPPVRPVFGEHGGVLASVAAELSLKPGIPVAYKAGDQLNNAFSLNVLRPGEVAATAGTSGVIYGVSDALTFDPQSRINSFAHVNHSGADPRIGVLLCINGVGIFNRWLRQLAGPQQSYAELNAAAGQVPAGARGLRMLPFGNGAERMLGNRLLGAQVHGLDFNTHTSAHLVRAAQESLAFAFRYGLDIMRANGMEPTVIRAGSANLFLSEVFTRAFVDAAGVPVELYSTDGSVGAALGAGVGAGIFETPASAFGAQKCLQTITPSQHSAYPALYEEWRSLLEQQLQNNAAATQAAPATNNML